MGRSETAGCATALDGMRCQTEALFGRPPPPLPRQASTASPAGASSLLRTRVTRLAEHPAIAAMVALAAAQLRPVAPSAKRASAMAMRTTTSGRMCISAQAASPGSEYTHASTWAIHSRRLCHIGTMAFTTPTSSIHRRRRALMRDLPPRRRVTPRVLRGSRCCAPGSSAGRRRLPWKMSGKTFPSGDFAVPERAANSSRTLGEGPQSGALVVSGLVLRRIWRCSGGRAASAARWSGQQWQFLLKG